MVATGGGWPVQARRTRPRQRLACGAHESEGVVVAPHQSKFAQSLECVGHDNRATGIEGGDDGIGAARFGCGDDGSDRQGDAVKAVECACRRHGRTRA
jgi:hypothetical protein